MQKCADTVEKVYTLINHVRLKTPHAFAITGKVITVHNVLQKQLQNY